MKLLNNREVKEISGSKASVWFKKDEINVHLTDLSDNFIWHGGFGVGKIAMNSKGKVAAHNVVHVDHSDCLLKIYTADVNYTVFKNATENGFYFTLTRMI